MYIVRGLNDQCHEKKTLKKDTRGQCSARSVYDCSPDRTDCCERVQSALEADGIDPVHWEWELVWTADNRGRLRTFLCKICSCTYLPSLDPEPLRTLNLGGPFATQKILRGPFATEQEAQPRGPFRESLSPPKRLFSSGRHRDIFSCHRTLNNHPRRQSTTVRQRTTGRRRNQRP
jgi:hypothetical protein